MSNTIIELKHSQVSGNTPSALANGEISINTNDGKIFYKHPNGSILAMERYTGPSGLDGELQFNDSGDLGASSNLTFNKSTGVLTIGGGLTVGSLNVVPTVNLVFNHANGAFDKANSSNVLAQLSYNKANDAFDKANASNVLAQSAYNKANSIPVTNSFETISVIGQQSVVANSNTTNLTLISGSGIAITTDANTKSITFSTIPDSSAIWSDGSDFGLTTEVATVFSDLGDVTESPSVSIDLGLLVVGGIIQPSMFILPSYTVNTLPNANPAGQVILVSDEVGGTVPAFSDGTNWRRMTDRAIVS